MSETSKNEQPKNDASKILSANSLTELQNNAIDYGAAFLIGASTNGPSTSAMSLIGNTVGVASGVANIVGSGMENAALTASIVADGLTYLTSSMTEFLAYATSTLMTLPLNKISESFNTHFYASIIEPKEFLKKLNESAEKRQEEQNKKSKNDKQKKVESKASKKIKEVTSTVNNALSKAKDQLNSIASYTSKGPEWMSDQIEKYTYMIMNQVVGDLNKTIADFQKEKDDWAKDTGKMAAEQAAQPVNDMQEKALKKSKEKSETQKEKLSNKSKANAAKLIMKLKGLFGA